MRINLVSPNADLVDQLHAGLCWAMASRVAPDGMGIGPERIQRAWSWLR